MGIKRSLAIINIYIIKNPIRGVRGGSILLSIFQACYRIHVLGETIDLRDIPSVVGGDQEKRHGIVLAKSIPAKKYKIQTGEPIVSALNKCPNLTIVKPNYELYVHSSNALIKILKEISPRVEQYSIDEAFCDMTGTESLYGSPIAATHYLKDRIQNELGFTVNVGCSTNKLLAKMVLLSLCETVGTRLRADKVKASCISASITDCEFEHSSHQSNVLTATNVTNEIYSVICRLFDELWDKKTPIRQLGVHTSKITNDDYRQYNMFDMYKYDKLEKLDTAIDSIRERYGDDSVMRACFLDSHTNHMVGGIAQPIKSGITKPIELKP